MKSAVLVIDVQRFLFDPEPKPYESDSVLNRINHITSWARAKEVPVVFIQHEQANSAMAAGSEGWKLQRDLHVEASDLLVAKTTPDAFLNTCLESLLKQHNIKHLIVCGYASEFCVDTTVRRAAGLGYSVSIVSDAHTTHDKPHATGAQIRAHHNATLPNITSFGVQISAVPTEGLGALG